MNKPAYDPTPTATTRATFLNDAERAALMKDAERCPSTMIRGGGYSRKPKSLRCQQPRGHDGECTYHRAGGQGGSLLRWWGANTEPACTHPVIGCLACGEPVKSAKGV